MKLEAKIIIKENSKALAKLFRPELAHLQQERSTVVMVEKGNELIFTIQAKDSVALRSNCNGITKLITVFEKTKELDTHEE